MLQHASKDLLAAEGKQADSQAGTKKDVNGAHQRKVGIQRSQTEEGGGVM